MFFFGYDIETGGSIMPGDVHFFFFCNMDWLRWCKLVFGLGAVGYFCVFIFQREFAKKSSGMYTF